MRPGRRHAATSQQLHLRCYVLSHTNLPVHLKLLDAMADLIATKTATPDPSGASKLRRRETRPERLINGVLAAVLVAVVLAAPLPAGSNRGAAWMLWAPVVAGSALVYGLTSWLAGARLRNNTLPWPTYWLLAVFILFALLQTVPLAALLPAALLPLPVVLDVQPRGISLVPAATQIAALRFATGAVFLVLLLLAAGSRRRSRRVAWALFLAVLFYAIWAVFSLRYLGDTFFWGDKVSYRGTATGPFINRNSFATFLGMGAVLGLALGLDGLRPQKMGAHQSHPFLGVRGLTAALSLACVAVILVVQLATQSRMGVAATLVALALVWVLSSAPGRARATLWLGLGLLGLIVMLALFSLGADLIDRLILSESAFGPRRALYQQVWQMILARPLTGYGLDSFPAAYELFHRPPVSPGLVWDNAHSSYLTLWVEMGLVIGSIPLLVGLMFAARLWRNLATDRTFAAAALGCLVLVGLHATVDFSIEMQANQMLLLAILALGLRREA